MVTPGLRVSAAASEASELSAEAFQAACVEGFVASWSARGFSPVTIENGTGVLDRFLDLLDIPAWEAGPDDVDRVVGELVARGLAVSTRRDYVRLFSAWCQEAKLTLFAVRWPTSNPSGGGWRRDRADAAATVAWRLSTLASVYKCWE